MSLSRGFNDSCSWYENCPCPCEAIDAAEQQGLLLCCIAFSREEGTTSGHVLQHACLHHARAPCTNYEACDRSVNTEI